jgi:hypothetical protein
VSSTLSLVPQPNLVESLRRTRRKTSGFLCPKPQGLIVGSWGTVPFRSFSCQHSIYPAYQVSRYHSQIPICAIRSNAPPKCTKNFKSIKVSLSGQEVSGLWHNMTCSTLAYAYEPIRTSNSISRTSFAKSAFHKNENDSPYPSRND